MHCKSRNVYKLQISVSGDVGLMMMGVMGAEVRNQGKSEGTLDHMKNSTKELFEEVKFTDLLTQGANPFER